VKQKNRRVSLEVGEDVTMGDIMLLSKRVVIGHARGLHLSVGFLKNWALEHWGSIVSNTPIISKLAKGWFMFLLSMKEEVDVLVKGSWEMAGVPIVLRKWTPIFDVGHARVEKN